MASNHSSSLCSCHAVSVSKCPTAVEGESVHTSLEVRGGREGRGGGREGGREGGRGGGEEGREGGGEEGGVGGSREGKDGGQEGRMEGRGMDAREGSR